MPHIHTKPGEHDHTASAFIVRTDGREPRILLHRHKKLGVYLQFGGHIETNETPWDAVVHELREESGYDISQLKILQPIQRLKSGANGALHPVPVSHSTHSFDDTHFHTDLLYAFVTDERPKYAVEGDESDDIKLVTRQELSDLPSGQTAEAVREAGLYVLDVCLKEWEAVDPGEFS